MRFRFCGGLDCPDWILAEIAVLAKLTSIKFRLLCQIVCQGIIEGAFQAEKAEKILNEAGLGISERKGCSAALTFIFKSSAKYECKTSALNNELQQLGLPAELANQLCKIYDDSQTKIKLSLKERTFTLPTVTASNGEVSRTEDDVTFAQFTLNYKNPEPKTAKIALSTEKLRLLVQDLRQAATIMEELEPASR